MLKCPPLSDGLGGVNADNTGKNNSEKRRAPPGRLSRLLKDSVMYQYFIAKSTQTSALLKFDPASQTSEVSLLKDMVGGETLARFQR